MIATVAHSGRTAIADCQGIPSAAELPREVQLADDSRNSAIGVESCGRLMAVWHTIQLVDGRNQRVIIQRVLPDAALLGSFELVTRDLESQEQKPNRYRDPSIAVSPSGHVRVAWLGSCPDCHPNVNDTTFISDFEFNASPVPIAVTDDRGSTVHEFNPSAGASDLIVDNQVVHSVAWTGAYASNTAYNGVFWGINPNSGHAGHG